jgi:hypothetical protein
VVLFVGSSVAVVKSHVDAKPEPQKEWIRSAQTNLDLVEIEYGWFLDVSLQYEFWAGSKSYVEAPNGLLWDAASSSDSGLAAMPRPLPELDMAQMI